MIRHFSQGWARVVASLGPSVLVVGLTASWSACTPTQPFYLGERGDLTHYIDTATTLEHPDVEIPAATEAQGAAAPLSIADPDAAQRWPLALEDVVQITLNNTKVLRGGNQPPLLVGSRIISPGNDTLTTAVLPGGGINLTTVYNPAVQESAPGSVNDGRLVEESAGVEAALAAFDAQLSTSLNVEKIDRPQNIVNNAFNLPFNLQQNLATFNAQLSKRTAEGTELFFRNTISYDRGNAFGANQALSSYYEATLEVGGRQPLLRGRGAQINRMPVVIARIQTDKELAELEGQINNMIANVEIRYWDLTSAYRVFEETKDAHDKAVWLWREISSIEPASAEEAQARETVFALRAELEAARHDLYFQETNLRWLMGLAASDGRLIVPMDVPTTAVVRYDWCQVVAEALIRRPEIRRTKWEVKRREMELILARNQLLPQLDATALYRWLGRGDELIAANRNGLNFPQPGSRAFDVLTEGDFQEFRVGLEMDLPIGFRRELAGVRHAQLKLAREKAVLEDVEIDVTRELTQAVRAVIDNRHMIDTHVNRRIASDEEVARTLENVEAAGQRDKEGVLLRLLLAYQRQFRAALAYHTYVTEYNKALALVQNKKGTILSYNGVMMGEGPWPQKASWDAMGEARKRSAGTYIDYGYTRPKVISEGQTQQGGGVDAMPVSGGQPIMMGTSSGMMGVGPTPAMGTQSVLQPPVPGVATPGGDSTVPPPPRTTPSGSGNPFREEMLPSPSDQRPTSGGRSALIPQIGNRVG